MAARVEDGWLMAEYNGPELAPIEMWVAGEWHDAYLGFDAEGNRVAKIPWSGPAGEVRLRAAGNTVTFPGPAA